MMEHVRVVKRLVLAAALLGAATACSGRSAAPTACVPPLSPPSTSQPESMRSPIGVTLALQKASALIRAAEGGVVRIPSGSVRFSPHTFESDTKVTLELLSAPNAQPVNAATVAKGEMMTLHIGSAAARSGATSKRSNAQLDRTPVVITQSLPSSERGYSSQLAPQVEYNHPAYGPVWMDFGGSVRNRIATLRVPATIFAEAAGGTLRFIPVDDLAPGKPYYGGLVLNKGTWQHFDVSSVPRCGHGARHAIVFVHGILSAVDSPRAFAADKAQAIQSAGGYDAVYGFNYQWWLPPNVVRPLLAKFVNSLYKKGYFDAYDLEAHSYGGVVSLFALSNRSSRGRRMVSPLNFITLGSPLGGTSAATLDYLKSVLENNKGIVASQAELVESAHDGMTVSISPASALPGGALYRAAAAVYPDYAPARTIKVGGSAPFAVDAAFGILKYLQLIKVFFAGEYDGIVTTDSALSPNVPTTHQAAFALWHWELTGSPGVIQYVASQLEPVPQWRISAVDSRPRSTVAPCRSTPNVFCVGLDRGQAATVRVSDATGQYSGPMVALVPPACPYLRAAVGGTPGPNRTVRISANAVPAASTTCKVTFQNWNGGNLLPPFSRSPEIDVRVGTTP